MHGNHPQTVTVVLHECDPCCRHAGGKRGMDAHTHITRTTVHSAACSRVDWTTWWPWRGAYTRSHPELGREIPQRPWYCVLRHGRVGRRQVFQSTLVVPGLPRDIDVLPPGATVGIPQPP